MTCRLFLQTTLATAWLCSSVFIVAEETPPIGASEEYILSPADEEFIKIATEFDSHVAADFAGLETLVKELGMEEAHDYFMENQPGCDGITKLLEFEEQHGGELVGLMALRKVFQHAGRFGLPGKQLAEGIRDALIQLPAYSKLPELSHTLKYIGSGYREPAVELCLRKLIEADDVLPVVRAEAQFRLAEWMLGHYSAVKYRDARQARILKLKDSKNPQDQAEVRLGEFELTVMPDIDTYAKWEIESNKMLANLIAGVEELYVPTVTNVDENYYIVRAIKVTTDKQATIQERATSLIYHRIGGIPNNISATLVDGTKWSLSDQKGKVVLIQFSFTGCAPCKRMYPELTKIYEKYSDSMTLLTIMRDDDLDKTRATVAENKMEWNVCWDEEGITNKWAVNGFPTVYIVGRDGRIAAMLSSYDALAPTLARIMARP